MESSNATKTTNKRRQIHSTSKYASKVFLIIIHLIYFRIRRLNIHLSFRPPRPIQILLRCVIVIARVLSGRRYSTPDRVFQVCASRREHEQVLQGHHTPQHFAHQRSDRVHHIAQRVVFVGNDSVHGTLKVAEHREPDTRSIRVKAHVQRMVVGQRVVIEEQSGWDVKGDKHVNWVMLVCGQNEEDPEHIQQPGDGVQEIQATWSI